MPATLDCSAITNDDLSRHLEGLWQFPQAILYSFHGSLTAQQAADMPANIQPPYRATRQFRDVMRQTMQYWQSFSDGLLQFKEVPYLKPEQPGILLAVCGTADQFHAYKPYTQGFAQRWYGSPGFFHRAIACFPQGVIESGSLFSELVRNHEVYHALGAGHFHEGKTGDLLRQILYGKACSVMPYSDLIDTAVSRCPPEICPAGYATMPGPTDKQFLMAAYNQTSGWLPKQVNRQMYVEMPMHISTVYATMLVRSALQKISRSYSNRQLNAAEGVTPLQRRSIVSLSELVIDLVSITALITSGVARPQEGTLVLGFMATRMVGAMLRLSECQCLEPLARVLTGDGLWHTFVGVLTVQQPLVMGGVAELGSGLAHTAASVVGANSIDYVGSLFYKGQQPVLPVSNSPARKTSRLTR